MNFRLTLIAILFASAVAFGGQHGLGGAGDKAADRSGTQGLPNFSVEDAKRPELSQRVVVIGTNLYFLHDKKVYEKNLGSGVVRTIDDAGNAVAIFSMKGKLYGLNDSGQTFLWNNVSAGTKAVAAVVGGVVSDWTKVGESAQQVGVVGDKMYEITRDHRVKWSDGEPSLFPTYPYQNQDGSLGTPVFVAQDTFKPTRIGGIKSLSLVNDDRGETKDLELTFLGGSRRSLSTALSQDKLWDEMKTPHQKMASKP